MDVNEMFHLPKLGSLKNKRKLDTFAPSPAQLAKVAKLDGQSSATTTATPSEMPPPALPASAKGKGRAATIEDGSDDEEGDNEPDERSFAPGNDSDYFVEEDGEGRMYGGGLTTTQKRILEIMDDGGDEDADAAPTLTLPIVRKKLLDLEKAINKNREQRTRYSTDPTK